MPRAAGAAVRSYLLAVALAALLLLGLAALLGLALSDGDQLPPRWPVAAWGPDS
jgi:hypothetical protein